MTIPNILLHDAHYAMEHDFEMYTMYKEQKRLQKEVQQKIPSVDDDGLRMWDPLLDSPAGHVVVLWDLTQKRLSAINKLEKFLNKAAYSPPHLKDKLQQFKSADRKLLLAKKIAKSYPRIAKLIPGIDAGLTTVGSGVATATAPATAAAPAAAESAAAAPTSTAAPADTKAKK